ncbi:glycine cleavage system protein GcvH [Candidatus Thorarchaeota archaeon]|jgi:glycine cleavage system H protein|nr:MAG: glycine cleavage system protein GcvH [Candidatus Thorarchaeota archaeon]
MSEVPTDRNYSKEHEWAKAEGGLVTVGITDHAQNSLHEITFVEISEAGTAVKAGDECGLVESMKASSDLFSPVSGEIVEVNSELEDAPEIVNEDCYGKGWMFKVKPSNLDAEMKSLLDAEAYKKFLESS